MNRLPELIRGSAERFPTAPALASVRAEGGWSYAELQAGMERGAARLRALDVPPGERVLLFAEACPAWPVAFFSILEAGLVAVPLPVETPVATAAGVAAFAGARLAVVGQRTATLGGSGVRCVRMDALFEAGPVPAPPVGPMPELALLAFTSGSTSQPRAVELTHANLLANLRGLLQSRQAGPGDAFLSMLPPAHLFELMVGLLGPLACGARVVYTPSLLPHRLVHAVREHHITHALSVPALLQVLYEEVLSELVDAGHLEAQRRGQSLAETSANLRAMSSADVARLRVNLRERLGPQFRTLVIGGAALDPDWAAVIAAAGLQLEIGYGLTEASPIVSIGLAREAPPGSAGRPLPGVEVRVAEDEEVLVRGPNVMRGYFRAPEATASALRHGWLHTGDRGRLDADGFLFIIGRLKEALVTAAGETLYPEEVEPCYASPLFAECCVAGVPGPQGNDVPTLFVVPVSPAVAEPELRRAFEDLRAAAPARLRVPQLVCLPGPLPRTVLGKIRRRFVGQHWHNQQGAP